MDCPCGSSKSYESCCDPFIKRQQLPKTAEELMRSRYSAYTKLEMKYLKDTLAPESQSDFDLLGAKKWARESEWLGLKILSTEKGTYDDTTGRVEFIASYKQKNQIFHHHENSVFRKTPQGQWLFVSGESETKEDGAEKTSETQKPQTLVRESEKIGRNDPCPCGSGKKYKKCCG
ncbi:MAG: YchJ family protein [Bdellovibrionaceae bacterium]|nr:YchJ family protein [Pseudobdellovibrionaceae bacterium]